MRFKIGDEKLKDLLFVLVNNKRVLSPIEVDTDEDWVDCLVPKVQPIATVVDVNPSSDKPEETAELEWDIKRLYGKIQLIYKS